MTRRMLLGLPGIAGFLMAQSAAELDNEFTRLYNDFVADLNLLLAGKIKGKWDVRVARDVEKDFQKLTEHPGWISTEGRKR